MIKSGAIIYLGIGVASGTVVGWLAKDSVDSKSASEVVANASKVNHIDSTGLHSDLYSSPYANSEFGVNSVELSPSSNTPLSSDQIEQLGGQFSRTLDPIEREKLFDRLLASMTIENAEEIREYVKGLRSYDPSFRKFNYRFGQIGGQEAVLFGLNSPEKDGGAIFKGWASTNPVAAADWFKTLEGSSIPEMEVLAERGITEKMLIRDLHDDLVEGIYINDPSEAAFYLSNLDDDQLRFASASSQSIVRDLVARNGAEAAEQWVSYLPEGKIATSAISELADEWSEQDSAAALAWASEQNNKELRQTALYEVWKNMGAGEGGTDAYVAAEQINAMVDSADKDYALSGFAQGTRREFPATAVEAAMSIKDPKLRDSQLLQTASYYLRRKPTEAKAWLADSGLSEDLVSKITAAGNRRR